MIVLALGFALVSLMLLVSLVVMWLYEPKTRIDSLPPLSKEWHFKNGSTIRWVGGMNAPLNGFESKTTDETARLWRNGK